ncbi:MAG: NADH-quinone oxidoreductase subunit N [Chloroflexi bacterium]|nr:NADH-quinone oxidoreductase subunit N [Chloroflexota bacterium]
MTVHDIYLLSPELALVALGLAIVLLDLVVQRKGVLGAVALVGLVVPFALSILLWGDVHAEPTETLSGLFGTLVVDKFALFFKFLVLGIVALLVLASTDYVSKLSRSQGEYYALILLSATGMMLLAATTDLIAIYVALELASLPVAALIAMLHTDPRSPEAGIKFLLLSAMSSAILLYGMAFIYGFTGSTKLPVIAHLISSTATPGVPLGAYPVLLGVVLVVAGFGFKLSAAPFHMWTPDVYEGAPTPITAFLSVASKAAAFAVTLRVFYVAFEGVSLDWALLFAALSALSMTVGNVVAIAQSNIKRLLGYSTIAHAGYMLVGVAAIAARAPAGDGSLGPQGVLFYLGAYAATNLAAFFAVIAVCNKIGSERIEDFAGMARRAPWLAGVLAFALVSLTGIPPTAGFMGKLFLFSAAVDTGLLWLAVVGVVNSVVSAYYYLRVVKVMYLQPPPSEEQVPSSVPFRAALAVAAIGVLVLGVLPGPLLDVARAAVATIVP